MRFRRALAAAAVLASVCGAAGCTGVQSALSPAGVEAAALYRLTIALAAGAAVIWLAVIAVSVYAARARKHGERGYDPRRREAPDAIERRDTRSARLLILGGGVIFPVVTLAALLVLTMNMLPPLLATGSDFVIDVTGEQWWWRVRYRAADGSAVDTANEIRLPAGRRATFRTQAADVIHSLWIPSLGGKIDMIPGRVTQLAVEPTLPGRYRGVCAEFCGASHALMAFDVVVMEQDAFDTWLAAQAQDALAPSGAQAQRGQRAFLDNGCGACHRIRGTQASGEVGPDLTHVGSRLTIAAGTLPATAQDFAAWISEPEAFKPGAEMPGYHMLGEGEVPAIAAYLAELR